MRVLNFDVKKLSVATILLIFGLGVLSGPCLAAEKPQKIKKTTKKTIAAEIPSQENQNVEKLMSTMNETLEENRRIRQSMRELQAAFEKVTLEKSDLLQEMSRTQRLAQLKAQEAGARADDLSSELEKAKKEIGQLQRENQETVTKKKDVETQLKELDQKKNVLQETLKGAILEKERDEIQERIRQNDAVVEKTLSGVSDMNRENETLRLQLIESYFDLGNLFYDIGRYEEAIAQYGRVLEWNPNHAWAHHNLAVIYDYHFKQIPKAIQHYQAYLHLKLASEEAKEVRIRVWDLEHLSDLRPDPPLNRDFQKNLKN